MARGKKQSLSAEELVEQALVPEEDQPYEVPGNWVWVIGKAAFGNMESTRPTGDFFKYIDIDAIDNKNQKVLEPKTIKVEEAPSRASRKVNEGDTLFSLVRPYLRNIAYIDSIHSDCIASTGFYVCHPNKMFNPRYIYYLMTSEYIVNGLNANMKGDNSPSIRKDDIENFAYPLPPLTEQQRIVDRIESLFARLDQAKELAQNALDSFETRKAAILHKAFTGELTAKWREEHGMGMDSWETRKLKDCGKWYGGGTPSKSVNSYWENGTLMWVTPKDMKDKYITDTIDHITEAAVAVSSTQLIKQPSLLFVMRSGILRRILPIAIATDRVTINQDLKALIAEGVELEYLYWYCVAFESDIREKCSKSGTTVESIETTALYEYNVLIPSKEEQVAIISTINNLLYQEEMAQKACNVNEAVETMKKTILARAIRGELGTNDPSEASALELLKEVVLTH